jgi:hypothetical protein
VLFLVWFYFLISVSIHLQFGSSDRATLFEKLSPEFKISHALMFFVTDVHWSPKHCDDLLNSSRFYDVFLFFVTDVHWWIFKTRTLRRIPIFCHGCALMDIKAQNTVTYSCFSSRMCTDWYSSPEHCDDLLNSSKSSPQHCDVLTDSSRSINNK